MILLIMVTVSYLVKLLFLYREFILVLINYGCFYCSKSFSVLYCLNQVTHLFLDMWSFDFLCAELVKERKNAVSPITTETIYLKKKKNYM